MTKQRKDKGRKRMKYDNSLPKRYLYYLKRANAKGLEFSLSVEQFEHITSQSCAYCGLDGYGIDRMDCKLGYTIDNIVPCCTKCNLMKWMNTPEEFLKHVITIYNHQNTYI